MSIKENFHHTRYACYIGYVTQAIVNNLAPLLFLTFQKDFAISLDKIALMISINFGIQLVVDLLATKFVDKIGYRFCVVAAHFFAAAGLAGLALLPELFTNPYTGLVAAVSLYAVGGGLIEVLISPIVEACPTKNKEKAMSFLHSFYSWGQVLVVLLSTLFFSLIGLSHWRIVACIWAAVPLLNAFYFMRVPIRKLVSEEEGLSLRALFSKKIFWVLILLMICAGAAELSMSQWASAFAESGLNVSKTVGDLAGPCLFAVLMGCARLFYGKFGEKVTLWKFMLASGILCVISYLIVAFSPFAPLSLFGCALCGLSVGILWPGALSLAAKGCPNGGTAMFALLAFSGDIGCSIGPAVVGVVSDAAGGQLKTGLLSVIFFPVLVILGVLYYRKITRHSVVSPH